MFITDPQMQNPQIVTVQIRPADPPRSAFCRVPMAFSFRTLSMGIQECTVCLCVR